jgi:peroxiredoxin
MGSKLLLFTLIVITCLYGCSGNNRKFNVIGNINGMPEQTIVLEEINASGIITIVDSERSKADGHFELAGIAPEQGLYRIHFHNNKYVLLSIDNKNIKIDGDWSHIEGYTVSGSPSSEELRRYIVSVREHLRDFNTMSIVMDTLQAKGNDSILNVAQTDFQNMKLHFTEYVERYADTTQFEPNAVFAARMLNPASESHYLQAFTQSLVRRFHETKMTRDFNEYYTKIAATQKARQPRPSTVADGAMAPELSLQDVNGQTISLSSLRGKYVLIYFWTSQSGQCRGEDPYLRAAYERFKDKNFAMLGVSLDNDKAQWQKAIQDDHISWLQVSDLKGQASPAAATYGVQSLPANFLVDPDGKIIDHDLHGNALQERLQVFFHQPQQ